MQGDASRLRAVRIKTVLRIDQRTDFRIGGARRQSGLQQGSKTGRDRTVDFAQAATRQATSKLIDSGNPGGSSNRLRLLKTKRGSDASGKRGLDVEPKSVRSGKH